MRGGADGKRRVECQSVTLGRDAPFLGLSFSILAVRTTGQITKAPHKRRLVANVKEPAWPPISRTD